MTKYNVVATKPDGIVIGVEEYDPANDGHRDERKQAAADSIAARLGIPSVALGKRTTTGADGTEWGCMPGDFQVGMVEIGLGKWGFQS